MLMFPRRTGLLTRTIAFLLLLLFAGIGRTQETVGVTEITPNVVVFATKTGNVIALVGPDGALLIGTPSADSTARISSELANRTKSPVRYVVIAPGDPAMGFMAANVFARIVATSGAGFAYRETAETRPA